MEDTFPGTRTDWLLDGQKLKPGDDEDGLCSLESSEELLKTLY
jgi:hypothetical protein